MRGRDGRGGMRAAEERCPAVVAVPAGPRDVPGAALDVSVVAMGVVAVMLAAPDSTWCLGATLLWGRRS